MSEFFNPAPSVLTSFVNGPFAGGRDGIRDKPAPCSTFVGWPNRPEGGEGTTAGCCQPATCQYGIVLKFQHIELLIAVQTVLLVFGLLSCFENAALIWSVVFARRSDGHAIFACSVHFLIGHPYLSLLNPLFSAHAPSPSHAFASLALS